MCHDIAYVVAYLLVGMSIGFTTVYVIGFLQGLGLCVDFYEKQRDAETVFGSKYSIFAALTFGWIIAIPILALVIIAKVFSHLLDAVESAAKAHAAQ